MELAILFFFNDTATTEIYTLSLHDALPIFVLGEAPPVAETDWDQLAPMTYDNTQIAELARSEEHTSELQSRFDLVCRLLLEKKKLELIAQPLSPSFRATRAQRRPRANIAAR